MIANLLEPHQLGQNDAAPLDAVDGFQLFGEIIDRFLIESRLVLAQRAVGVHLRLIGEIGDYPLVRLEASENVGAARDFATARTKEPGRFAAA